MPGARCPCHSLAYPGHARGTPACAWAGTDSPAVAANHVICVPALACGLRPSRFNEARQAVRAACAFTGQPHRESETTSPRELPDCSHVGVGNASAHYRCLRLRLLHPGPGPGHGAGGRIHRNRRDIYWEPSNPPFRIVRPAGQRRALLLAEFARHPDSVVAGSVNAWGAEVEDGFDGIVFLYVETALRVARLRAREQALYGAVIEEFIEWAAQYDAGPPRGRSLPRQRAWLAARSCPVLCLEGDLSTAQRLARIRPWLRRLGPTPATAPACALRPRQFNGGE